jgi:hypothetical protein
LGRLGRRLGRRLLRLLRLWRLGRRLGRLVGFSAYKRQTEKHPSFLFLIYILQGL